jgi:hypothetical protein
LNKLITKVQAAWRGYSQRKRFIKMQTSELREIGKSFNKVSAKGVQFKEDQDEGQKKGSK